MKYFSPHKPIIYLVICFLLCNNVSHARNNITTQLSSISGQLFKRNNPRFILVDALKDSLILANHPYELSYDDKGITINGRIIPEPFQSTYRRLMENFHQRQNVEMNGKVVYRSSAKGSRMAGDGLSLAEILDHTSGFWTQYSTDPTAQYLEQTKAARHSDSTNAVLNEMAAEAS